MNCWAATGLRAVPMLSVMAAIFTLSAQPGDSLSLSLFPGADKLAHMAIYGLLALATIFVFTEHQKKTRLGTVLLLSVGWCLVYGMSDEFHQSFVAGRLPSPGDILADLFGAVLACVFYVRWRAWRTPPLPS